MQTAEMNVRLKRGLIHECNSRRLTMRRFHLDGRNILIMVAGGHTITIENARALGTGLHQWVSRMGWNEVVVGALEWAAEGVATTTNKVLHTSLLWVEIWPEGEGGTTMLALDLAVAQGTTATP